MFYTPAIESKNTPPEGPTVLEEVFPLASYTEMAVVQNTVFENLKIKI